MKLRKIILSLFSIGVVAAVAVYASQAFFSDTETSTGNSFVAGAIDLEIDNESYAIDWNIPYYNGPTGKFVASSHTSWQLKDLTIEKFFDFVDLKPGDYGEDTISIHVNNNDAYVCATARLTEDDDNTYTEPEESDDPTVGTDPTTTDGELDEEVNFVFWLDDGDNVFESDEEEGILGQGPISGLDEGDVIALADSETRTPLLANTTVYIGKYWCFGEISLSPVDPEDGPNDETRSPLTAGTGFTCNGAYVNNAAQTDVVVGDVQFYAVQARHNDGFSCSNWTPDYTKRLVLENKDPSDWSIIEDDIHGVLTWKGDGPTFDFSSTLTAQVLQTDTDYSLIYYADPWPGNHPGALLGTGKSGASGEIVISGNPDLGMDLPDSSDANYAVGGAKIWLVLSSDYNANNHEMTAWNPDEYLFEYNLITYDDTDS